MGKFVSSLKKWLRSKNIVLYKILQRFFYRTSKLPLIVVLKVEYFLFKKKEKHSLPAELIVSLTSFPLRFKTLHRTLLCLVNQSITPDRIILWISYGDRDLIPRKLKQIKNLEIRFCEDLKQFKKIIPALQTFPNSFIITADDDLYYKRDWVKYIVANYEGNNKEVLCLRAKEVVVNENNEPLDYLAWRMINKKCEPSIFIFPTSGAGVLYPPHIFSKDVTDMHCAFELCPTSDDIWLWWMMRLNGGVARKVGPKWISLNSSMYNQVGLWYTNLDLGGNNLQMQAMRKKYKNEIEF